MQVSGAMISLTTSAVAAVKAALSRARLSPASASGAEGLRLVAGADAADMLTVALRLDVAHADDVIIEQAGLKLFVDARSHAYAEGLRIDFVAAPGSGGFVVEAGPGPRLHG